MKILPLVALLLASNVPVTALTPADGSSAPLDALIEPGDLFLGLIVVPQDVDRVRFAGVAGERLTARVKAHPGSALHPRLELVAVQGEQLLVGDDAKHGTARIGPFSLPATGLYELRCSALDDSQGGYKLSTWGRVPAKLRKLKLAPSSDPELVFTIDARAEARLIAKVRPVPGSGALPGEPALTGPEGVLDLTDLFQFKGKSLRVNVPALADTGSYTLSVPRAASAGAGDGGGGGGGGGDLKGVLRLSPSHHKPQTFTEPQAQASIGFVTSSAQVPEAAAVTSVLVQLGLPPGELLSQPVQATVDLLDDGPSQTAVLGADYQADLPQTLFFGAGAADGAQIAVPITPLDDVLVEGTEQLVLELSVPAGPATIGLPDTSVLQLIDDDLPPPPPPPSIALFTVSNANPHLGDAVQFDWTLENVSGVAGGGDGGDPASGVLRCELDPDADGLPDYVFADCTAGGSQVHVYTNGGVQGALLRLFEDDALVDTASVVVDVEGLRLKIIQPLADGRGGPLIQVQASASSVFALSQVEAKVGDSTAQLDFVPYANLFEGTLDLSLQTEGPVDLLVTALDFGGDFAQQQIPYHYDSHPTLNVVSPVKFSVASPMITANATCSDVLSAHCLLKADVLVDFSGNFIELFSGQDAVNQAFDLSPWDGKPVRFRYRAFDDFLQPTFEELDIFVEASTHLQRLDTVPGEAIDIDATHVLYEQDSPLGPLLGVYDTTTQTGSLVPMPIDRKYEHLRGRLTPTGAVFVTRLIDTSGPADFRFFDWNNGSLIDLGAADSVESLVVAGDLGIWSNGSTLTLRDFSAGTNQLVSSAAGNNYNDLTPAGQVAYWSSDHEIHLWEQGVDSVLTNDQGVPRNTMPRTDGNLVAYTKTFSNDFDNQAVAIQSGGVEVVLTPFKGNVAAGLDYQVAGGWVAFTQEGTMAERQVWLRNPAGLLTQLTFFSSSSRIDSLAPNGEVMIRNGPDRHLYKNGTLTRISTSQGRVFWLNNKWHTLLGNAVFELP